jgi:bifunctional oligoribonuclease and PAP phosphatase NrnA
MKTYDGKEYEPSLIQAGKFISDNDDFLVVAHIQPDGDAVASTAAMGWILKQLGKKYTLINENTMPEKFLFLPGVVDLYNGTSQIERTFSNVIALDCGDYSRVGSVHSLIAENANLLNIDHHPTNDYYGTHQVINANAAATVEILYDLAVLLELKLNDDFANLIYAGLLTDTGGFRYSSTSSKVLIMAARLLELGANGPELANLLLERMTFEQVSMLQQALPTLTFSPDRKIAWIVVTSELIEGVGASNEDLDGLINFPRNVEGVEVGLLVKQRGEAEYKVSFRSAGRVDVALIAKGYGGGGHVRASGCTMHGRVEDIIEQLIQEVGKQLR